MDTARTISAERITCNVGHRRPISTEYDG
jgi:hypothetical protein